MRAVLVPPLVPSGVSPLAPACLMFAAVCLDALLPSSHHLALDCVPSPFVCLGSCLYSASPRHRCRCRCRPAPLLLATRPASSTRRAGRYDGAAAVLSALLACSLRLAISSVRFGIGWRRGCSLLRPMAIIGAACYQLTRPIRFPCRPAAPIASLRPSSPITRHGERGGASWSRLLVFAVLFRLLSICVGSVYCGGGDCLACLNGVYLFLSMGDVVARRCVSGL